MWLNGKCNRHDINAHHLSAKQNGVSVLAGTFRKYILEFNVKWQIFLNGVYIIKEFDTEKMVS